MNSLNNFDKTDREYSLAPTDLIRFWKSVFKLTAGHYEDTLVNAGASTSIFGSTPSRPNNMGRKMFVHTYVRPSTKNC